MEWFLHVDMDAFYASVEQALNPKLKGKAVIVGGGSGKGVVTSASYEARKYGVHSAMPGFRARKLCPNGIFLPNRRRTYVEYSRKVFGILEHYSPEVDSLSIDEGVIDLTGTERLFGPPLGTAHQILERIKKELDLAASAGLSGNRTVSKIAATLAKPSGLIYVPHGSEERFLSPLPVSAMPGVGPKSQKELLAEGIRTVGDLIHDSRLRSRYHPAGESGERSAAHDHSIGNETTVGTPLQSLSEMSEVLWGLVEEVGGRLRKGRWYARCVSVKIRYSDFKTITRSRTLPEPTCFDREIYAVAVDLVKNAVAPGRPVRLLGVSASSLVKTGWQQSMFDVEKRRRWEKLYEGIDELRRKYGEEAIGAGTPFGTNR
jgi:DNA polymerase-4